MYELDDQLSRARDALVIAESRIAASEERARRLGAGLDGLRRQADQVAVELQSDASGGYSTGPLSGGSARIAMARSRNGGGGGGGGGSAGSGSYDVDTIAGRSGVGTRNSHVGDMASDPRVGRPSPASDWNSSSVPTGHAR